VNDQALHESAAGYAISLSTLAAALAGLVILARAKDEETAPSRAPAPDPA
jgi:hypothetical protein